MKTPMLAAAALVFTLGCGVESVGDGEEPGEDPDPVTGRYQLTSTYDLSSSDAAPGFFSDILGPLANLREDPAGTVFAILESSGDGLADLIELLPPDLRAELEEKINDFVTEQLAAGTTGGEIINWIDEIAGILTNFDVVSEFDVSNANDAGIANGNHNLSAVRFALGGESRQVDVTDAISLLTAARDIDCEIADSGSGLAIDIADHAFHLPLGELAVVGLNTALKAGLGVNNIGEALNQAINCVDLAASVGEQCLGPICIDESKIAEVCSSGVDKLGEKIEEAVASVDFAELRLGAGHADLSDVAKGDGFGQIDQWDGGTWQSTIDVDGFAIPVEATFSANRL